MSKSIREYVADLENNPAAMNDYKANPRKSATAYGLAGADVQYVVDHKYPEVVAYVDGYNNGYAYGVSAPVNEQK